MAPMKLDTRESSLWRYSTLHPPGNYLNKRTGQVTVWSGKPRFITRDLQAEWNAAAQMRALGLTRAELTPVNCIGIDIRSPTAVAQVKREVTAVGRPHLYHFYESCQVSYLDGEDDREKEKWFFSASGYARTAIEYADHRSILLFTYSVTGQLTPVNQITKDRYSQLLIQRDRRIEWKKQQHARMRERQRNKLIPGSDPRPDDDGTLWAFWPVKEA